MNNDIRILCVDDEPNILSTLQRFFRRDNVQLLLADSAEEAMKLLQEKGPVQIILSDYRMPGMNGVEFLQQVHLLWPQTKGILLSGFADLGAVSSAIDDDSIFRYVRKPWDRNELRGVIDEALSLS
ncbi:MAG: hypothetical protein C0618_03690 [Desulfuromonas sp.]|nr:MAG: hypothetical protein C0618_03690 [Desulfuromonas sp.]